MQYAGKKGLGLGQKKRQASDGPSSSSPVSQRPSKAPKVEAKEKESAEAFRERTRMEYEEKRAEARLTAATRTCIALDEQRAGLKVCLIFLSFFPPLLPCHITP